jgi:hypothetical protein
MDESTWAMPCLPPGVFEVPKEGQGVWVEFADGDPNQPVWVGVWYAGMGNSDNPTKAPFQAVHPKMTDFAGADAEPDLDHVDAKDPTDHAEHSAFHDHVSTFYTPHRRVWMSQTGHHLEFNDHPGKGGYVRLFERFGRLLEMTALGVTKLRSYIQTGFTDAAGNTGNASHRLILADGLNDPDGSDPDVIAGQYVSLKDMAGGEFRMESTAGQQKLELRDAWNQFLRIASKSGARYIQLWDWQGQNIKLDPETKTITVTDGNSNVITMTAGKVTISVAASSHVYVGGEGAAQQLATKDFVQSHFNTHTHVSSSPGTPTSPPIVLSPLVPGQDITKKQLSE